MPLASNENVRRMGVRRPRFHDVARRIPSLPPGV